MRNIIKLIFLICTIYSCTTKEKIRLSSIIDIDNIEKVKITNNSGSFYLTIEQIKHLKSDMTKLTYAEGMNAKVGAIRLTITINNIEYNLATATHGQLIEVPSNMLIGDKINIIENEFIYFNTNKVNFDNYKNEQTKQLNKINSFKPNWLKGAWMNSYDNNFHNIRVLAFSNDSIYSPNEENIQICFNDFYKFYKVKKEYNDSTYKITFSKKSENTTYEFKRSKEEFSNDTILTFVIIKNGKKMREHSNSCNLTFKKIKPAPTI